MSNIHALQSAELDSFWNEFEAVMGGPDGLMTYRYLGTHADAVDRHNATGSMVIRSDMRNPHGLMAAPLMILLADTIGILDDAIAVPAPTQMSLQLIDDGAGVSKVFCIGEMVHEGRTQLFSRAIIVDDADHSRVIGICRDAGAVIAKAPDGYRYVDPGPGVPDSPSLPPLWQAFGAQRRADWGLEIPELTGRIGSTSGSLHHGATQVLLEASATEAATAAAGGAALQLRHWHVTFTTRGKYGPFTASSEVVASTGSTVVVESEVRDEKADRRIAVASAVFDRL